MRKSFQNCHQTIFCCFYVAKDTKTNPINLLQQSVSCLWMGAQVQLRLSEQMIQEMIRQRIRKMEEIRESVSNLKVEQSYS